MTVQLNRQLVLETLDRVPDGAGGFAEIWMPLGTIWADIRARSGRESAGEASALSVVTFRIIVRGAPQGSSMRPVAGQRFRDGGRVFLIEAVAENDAAGRYLVCFAKEERVT
ncbi:head-tail adaptor protein [Pseudaestuariivita atlantica]|uniref:Tail protein n=1 Tax=Pseudaestuariivita atlantica TaxID=1317121 RepID=A0A0L1JLY3_9RHOB|nr:head-tail adaptor protein [Pseudaestuariivita atlantica]KNG92761.1 tail protein [Pseudaestuariivita atlantica]